MFRKLNRKIAYSLSVAVLLALLVASLALADNVVNDVTVGGTDTFTAGGSTLVRYKIVGTGGDGQAGCNASDGSAATVTINTLAGVIASPGSLTFTTCNDFQDVTLSSNTSGDYSITVSVSDSGAGSYNTTPGGFTLHVLAPPTPSDTTPPIITPNVSGTLGDNDWYTSDVTISWSEVDSESTISSTSGCDPTTISTDTAGTTLTCTATSAGGTSSESVTVKRDATPPDVSLVDGPDDGSNYYFGFVPAAPTCSASDATSGLAAPCSVAGYSNFVGSHTVTATAFDNAGNEGSDSASYEVLAWTLSGFYQPVDMNGVYNVVKGGSTVPLKFKVFAGPAELTDISVVKSFVQTKIACNSNDPTDEIEVTTTGGTSLRYDTTAGQFVQNWQTPKQSGQCYRVKMTTQDGSFLTANFKLK